MFRFTIRELLLLTVIVGLCVGWCAGRLVEISLGSDDGLKLRDVVEVYRGKQLLGRVAIQRLDLDKAVGRIDIAAGPIQKGDNVLFVYDPPITIRASPVPPSNH